MRFTSVFQFLLRILGPALLGVGTIFQGKANADDHWSTSPRVVIRVETASESSADPSDADERGVGNDRALEALAASA